jgi:signal transduction histidine kinase
MRERALLIGAELDVLSAFGEGTTVRLRLAARS